VIELVSAWECVIEWASVQLSVNVSERVIQMVSVYVSLCVSV